MPGATVSESIISPFLFWIVSSPPRVSFRISRARSSMIDRDPASSSVPNRICPKVSASAIRMPVSRSLTQDSSRRPFADASPLAALRNLAVASYSCGSAPCQRRASTPGLPTRVLSQAPSGRRTKTYGRVSSRRAASTSPATACGSSIGFARLSDWAVVPRVVERRTKTPPCV